MPKKVKMGNVINLISLEGYLKKLKTDGGMWEFKPGKWIIKHLEVEGLAQHYNIETNIDLVHCDLDKDVAVVKAVALHKTKKLPYSHELKFNMEYKQTPAVSWYIVNPTIEPETLELTEDDINTNKVFNEFILTHNDTVRQKASEASKRLDEAEGILDSEDFIEVEATAS